MSRKKRKWTMAEAVAWLRELVEDGETERADQDVICEQWVFASGVRAEIDDRTCELTGFTIALDDVASWPEEEFVWFSEWGECRTRVHHGKIPVWTTEPTLNGGNDRALVEQYNLLLNKYLELPWFDPSEAWCPEGGEDLPVGYLEGALDALGEVSFLADDDACRLYVSRNEKEYKKISRLNKHLRQLSRCEAACFIKDNYSDCYDWPDEV